MNLQEKIIALQVVHFWAKAIAYVFLAWLCVEVLIHIDNHGLKHLLIEIWNGPKND